ncbi:MAG: Sec-independent protein translocase protein TatB [Pseudomonadota bacterium]
MFDIGWTELLAIIIVAIVVIGPKDLPLAIRTAGRWVARGRRLMGQFRASIDSLAHEAEMEEMEKKWAEQNERIMREHGDAAPMLPGVTGYADNGDDQAAETGQSASENTNAENAQGTSESVETAKKDVAS